jgi:hypothetical protein
MAVDHQRVRRTLLQTVAGAGTDRLASAEGPDGHAVNDHRVRVEFAGSLQHRPRR